MPLQDFFQLHFVEVGLLQHLFDARLVLRAAHAGHVEILRGFVRFLRPSVFQRDGAVENQVVAAVFIQCKVGEALKLVARRRGGVF